MPASALPTPSAAPGVIETDALVIGAGPVGLWQVFQLGLQGIAAQVVDALPMPGGQCIELYPDKPIYDIPGLPMCTGRELVDRLLQQVRPFAPDFHLGQLVTQVQPQPDGRFAVASSGGQQWLARSLFIAAGVGAFQPRLLPVDGAERFQGRQIFYHQGPDQLAGQQWLVVGGDDAALQAVVDLTALPPAQRPACITLLHRRAALQAEPALMLRWQALLADGAVRFEVGQIVALEAAADAAHLTATGAAVEASTELAADTAPAQLRAVQIVGEDGAQRRMAVDGVLACLGVSPKLGPVAQWGLALQRRQLVVDAERLETSVPGIHAVGDVVSYPGKKKLILCGFHEATLATFAALQRLRPAAPTLLQYTTTSALLQQRLGVALAHGGTVPPAEPAD